MEEKFVVICFVLKLLVISVITPLLIFFIVVISDKDKDANFVEQAFLYGSFGFIVMLVVTGITKSIYPMLSYQIVAFVACMLILIFVPKSKFLNKNNTSYNQVKELANKQIVSDNTEIKEPIMILDWGIVEPNQELIEEEIVEQEKIEEQKRIDKLRFQDLCKFEIVLKHRILRGDNQFWEFYHLFQNIYDKVVCENYYTGGFYRWFNEVEEKSNIKEVFKICRTHFSHLNLEKSVEDEISAMKLIALEKYFDPELFSFFATEHNEKYKSDLFEYMYENCDDRFDFTERCLIIEDIFSGEWYRNQNHKMPMFKHANGIPL